MLCLFQSEFQDTEACPITSNSLSWSTCVADWKKYSFFRYFTLLRLSSSIRTRSWQKVLKEEKTQLFCSWNETAILRFYEKEKGFIFRFEEWSPPFLLRWPTSSDQAKKWGYFVAWTSKRGEFPLPHQPQRNSCDLRTPEWLWNRMLPRLSNLVGTGNHGTVMYRPFSPHTRLWCAAEVISLGRASPWKWWKVPSQKKWRGCYWKTFCHRYINLVTLTWKSMNLTTATWTWNFKTQPEWYTPQAIQTHGLQYNTRSTDRFKCLGQVRDYRFSSCYKRAWGSRLILFREPCVIYRYPGPFRSCKLMNITTFFFISL